jgi:predicted TIM-barrel fold metal-dependent hydrolase
VCYNGLVPIEQALPNVRVVDFHVHAFPDAVAERAMAVLSEAYDREPVMDGTVSGLTALMERTGLDYAVIQPVATKASQVQGINNWAASIKDPRIIAFGSMHPEYADIASETDRILSLGIPGIKIQATWQGLYVDDPRMYPIYEAAQGRLIIMFHSGDELGDFPQILATPQRIANIVRDFPNLTLIAAHMGGYIMWDEVEECLIGKKLYLDTSACFPEQLPDERLLKMIRNHGAQNILFATDMPLNDPVTDATRLAHSGLTDSELEMILSGNAKRLLPDRIL